MELHDAAESGDLEKVRALLDGGAAIDPQDHNGTTPLMAALRGKQEATSRLLVERGASMTLVDKGGRNALEWARGTALEAELVARGARPTIAEWGEQPYDQPDFSPYTKALLQLIRGERMILGADEETLAYLKEDMPPDLKALLHTWAHKPGSDRKSTRLNSSHIQKSRMPSSA